MKVNKSLIFLLALVVIVLLIYKGCGGTFTNRWKSDSVLSQIVFHGNKIITALELYKKNNLDYPEKLSNLIPNYLEEIPTLKNRYYRPEIHYIKTSKNNSFKESYQLIIFPKQFEILGKRSWNWVIYWPSKNYVSSRYRTIHKIYKNWSVETKWKEYPKKIK